MNHNVCLSVGQSVQKKLSEFLYVQILGKCRLLLLLLKNPPLQLKQVIDVIKVYKYFLAICYFIFVCIINPLCRLVGWYVPLSVCMTVLSLFITLFI